MNALSIGPGRVHATFSAHHFTQAAQHLQHLDHCARVADAHQRNAIKQQIDAVWRRILGDAHNTEQATRRAASVAGFMLGGLLLPQDLLHARRTGAGLRISDPFPFAAAALYAILDKLEMQDSTQALEDAFANMQVQKEPAAAAPSAWNPRPPAPWPPGPHSHL